jgi:hypothetical protein
MTGQYILGIVRKTNGNNILVRYFTENSILLNAITNAPVTMDELQTNELNPLHENPAVWRGKPLF